MFGEKQMSWILWHAAQTPGSHLRTEEDSVSPTSSSCSPLHSGVGVAKSANSWRVLPSLGRKERPFPGNSCPKAGQESRCQSLPLCFFHDNFGHPGISVSCGVCIGFAAQLWMAAFTLSRDSKRILYTQTSISESIFRKPNLRQRSSIWESIWLQGGSRGTFCPPNLNSRQKWELSRGDRGSGARRAVYRFLQLWRQIALWLKFALASENITEQLLIRKMMYRLKGTFLKYCCSIKEI